MPRWATAPAPCAILRAAALALTALAAAPVAAGQAGPRAVVPEPDVDLGVVALGGDVSHAFVVRNDGDAPLRLEPPDLPTGVSLLGLDREVGTGSTGTLRLAFDTFALRQPEFEFVVATNDPAQPSLRLHLKVLVRIFVAATPGYARYNYVQRAREGTVTQVLWATDGADFRVVDVASSLPHIRVRSREASPDERVADQEGPQWAVDMTIAADSPVGPIEGTVVVETDHPRQRHAWIPVSGFVRPMFAVTPPTLTVGEIAPAPQSRVVRLHVKNFAEETVELTSVTSDVAGITGELSPIEPGRTYGLLVTLSPELAPGPFQGTLRIRTASAKQPAVEVPVSGIVVAP